MSSLWSFDKLHDIAATPLSSLLNLCSSLFFLDLWSEFSEFPYFVLYGFRSAVSYCVDYFLDCGFAVVQRLSQSLRGFGVSLPAAWSHPMFVRYKASYPLFAASYPCSFDLLSWRSGHPCADSYRYLSALDVALGKEFFYCRNLLPSVFALALGKAYIFAECLCTCTR